MGDWSSISAIPLPAWLAVIVWILGSLAIQYFGHRNKQSENRQISRDPSWSDYADENRKLRDELDETREDLDKARDQVADIRTEFTKFKDDMRAWRTTFAQREEATRRVLSVIAYQAPVVNGARWRPTLEQRDLDILEDTLPAAWQ